MNWAAWAVGTVLAYIVTTVMTADAVGDLLPKDAFEKRFKRFAIGAVIIGAFSSTYVCSLR